MESIIIIMDKNNAPLRTGQDETLPDVMDMFIKLCEVPTWKITQMCGIVAHGLP